MIDSAIAEIVMRFPKLSALEMIEYKEQISCNADAKICSAALTPSGVVVLSCRPGKKYPDPFQTPRHAFRPSKAALCSRSF